MAYTLTQEDREELEYLSEIAKRNLGKDKTRSVQVVGERQNRLLDALNDGTAERLGIDADKKVRGVFIDPATNEAISIGFLEREAGMKREGTCFRFKRVYRVNGIVYYDLDGFFGIENPNKRYAHLD